MERQVQWLRVFAALEKDQSSNPSTLPEITTTYNFSSKASNALFWSLVTSSFT